MQGQENSINSNRKPITMAIKVKLGATENTQSKPFPKLMKFEDEHGITIVHFETHGSKGTQVYSSRKSDEGIQMILTDGWNIDRFTDYNEPITLQNQ